MKNIFKVLKNSSIIVFLLVIFGTTISIIWVFHDLIDVDSIAYHTTNFNNGADAMITLTDNINTKIYNLLVIATLYLTVLLSTTFIFQYFKSRDADKIEKKMLDEIQNLKTTSKQIEEKYTEMVKKLDLKVNQAETDRVNLIELLKETKRKNAELEIEVKYQKAHDAFKSRYFNYEDIVIDCYDDIFQLIDEYKDILSNARLGNIYNNYGFVYLNKKNYVKSRKYLELAREMEQSNQDQSITLSNLSELSLNEGDLSESISLANKSKAYNEWNQEAYITLIKAHSKTNNIEKAREIFNTGSLKFGYQFQSRVQELINNGIIEQSVVETP